MEQVERLAVEPDQRGHADDIPGVVLDDLFERAVVASSQVVRVAGRDIHARDVRPAHEAEHFTLQADQAARAEAAFVQPTRDMQQIEVRAVGQFGPPIHDHAPIQQRQIEGFSVVRHE